MKTVTLMKVFPVLVGLVCSIAFSPAQGYTQKQSSESSLPELVTYYSVKEYRTHIPELSNRITINLSNVSVAEALFRIAEKADLEIAFDEGAFSSGRNVTISSSSISVAEALEAALKDTGYESVITSRRQIMIKESEAGSQTAEEEIPILITGQVVDADTGEPLMGVTVFVLGTQTGTTTNMDGRFEIDVPNQNSVLAFSYVGYVRQELTVGDRTTINVELASDVALLDDVVVVGYGVQRRTEVTGSVASIRSRDIEGVPVASFENALQGRLAGVNVAESSGEPGAAPQILIRGTGSISAGNQPLFVIDGVPISQNLGLQDNISFGSAENIQPSSNPLATLNPNDIESIEVLKDASAAAIYGSRGSNGVILITTKRGNFDQPTVINFRSYAGVQSVFNRPDLMNAEELIQYTKDARNNTYLFQRDPTNPASPTYNPLFDPDTNAGREDNGATGNHLIPDPYVNWDGTDTDWVSLVLEPSVLQNYDMSVTGGSSTMSYFLGAGYMDQSGIIDGSGFKRYSLRSSLTGQITEKFRLEFQVNAAFNEHDRVQAHGPYFWNPPGIIYSAMTQTPVVSPYLEDGVTYRQVEGSHNDLGAGMTTTQHPLAVRDYIDDTVQNNRIFGSLSGAYSFLENLEFKTMLGYDLDNYQRAFYQGNQLFYRGGSPRPFSQSSAAQSFNWLWENTLNYNMSIGENQRINAVVGVTAQKQRNEQNRITAINFPDDQVTTINGGQVTGGTQRIEEWSLFSMLARVNYSLLDRYLVTATVRSDRSSRFGSNNQTGIFPSVSVGWQVMNEPFMSEVDLFNEIKPRLSYGITGNFEIPNYGSIGLVSPTNYVLNDQVIPGAAPSTLGNSELTWETTRQFNIGLDYAMLSDRIYGSFDYYISNTTDLLLFVNVPSSTGFTSALTNIGEVENKGFEIQFTSRNVVNSTIQWATDFNFGSNANKVTKLGDEGDPILSAGAAGIRHITMIGKPIGSYYGYVHDGIYMTQSEIDNGPQDLEGNPQLGDIRFKDVNGDGVINADDRTVIGNYQPDFQWGITNRFNYRNLDFSFFLQGVEGREILNLTSRHLKNGEANFNSYAVLNDRWISPENPGDGYHPRADRVSAGNNNRPSSYQVEDGSYVKLKNITLGYTLPPELLGNIASRARIYGSVTNVAIWSNYLGWNPEVNLQAGSALTPGEDYGAYPLSRAFQFGIDISF
jgi:TonB-linked SusC/RagA family outer membrane protein